MTCSEWFHSCVGNVTCVQLLLSVFAGREGEGRNNASSLRQCTKYF
jgi:hypothetical protein